MVQSNKVDFDVRKLLKRKKVSRDRMALPEHSECCIRRCRSSSDVCSMRLFAAKTTPLLRTPRIASPTTSRTQASKLSISPWATRCEPTATYAMSCDESNTPSSMHPAVFFRLALHIEGIGNQDKRPGTMQMNRTCTF